MAVAKITKRPQSPLYRRHLTMPQKIEIGTALKLELARITKIGRPPKQEPLAKALFEGTKIRPNLDELGSDDRRSDTRAAMAVGISRGQLAKKDPAILKAPEPVVRAWRDEEISTHTAHAIANSQPLVEAITAEAITVDEAAFIARQKELLSRVSSGSLPVTDIKAMAGVGTQLKDAYEVRLKERDYDTTLRVIDALREIAVLDVKDYLKALRSAANAEDFLGDVEAKFGQAYERMQQVKKEFDRELNTIVVDVKR